MEYYIALSVHLRTLKTQSMQPLLQFENITPLDNTDQQMREGKVSAEECLKALNDFQNEN